MYKSGDHQALSCQIKRIIDSPQLAQEIMHNGLFLANQFDSLEFLHQITDVMKLFSK
jgi:hypothetical protein